jgi:hypothetical protein
VDAVVGVAVIAGEEEVIDNAAAGTLGDMAGDVLMDVDMESEGEDNVPVDMRMGEDKADVGVLSTIILLLALASFLLLMLLLLE